MTVQPLTSNVAARYPEVMMNTFGAPKRVFVRGEGIFVWDTEGNRYTDFLSGLAVNSLGHAHPAVLAAITSQLSTLGHVSNFFATPGQVTLAERLVGLLGAPGKVFFTNSGTEANEAAFKATRRTGRRRIIAMEGSFHGRTMGALALTHNPAYREPFEPLPGEVTFVPYGDAAALDAALDETVAAVIIEPVQGENGVVTPPPDFLATARELTARFGALLWLDEVQTGIGRCGEWFAHQPAGITPDLVTLAKGLGSGFPIGVCIGIGQAGDLLQPGNHGTTFGGNPVAAIAGLAVLNVIERDGLLAHVREMGERLSSGIAGLGHSMVQGVRGMGLLRGIVLHRAEAAAVADRALNAGWIINAPRPNVLRIAPPLIVSGEQIDGFVKALPGLLDG